MISEPISTIRSTPFVSREFRLFFLARLANSFGTNIMIPSVGWQIYALTRDPLSLGLIGLWTFVPVALSSLPSGQAADRLERRRVYCVSQIVLVGAAISFFIITLAQVRSPTWFYVGVALFGAAKTFSMPSANAWMPHLVPRELFPNAVAWTSSTYQMASVAGPALAGLMLGAFGAASAYALAAGCYLASLVLASLIRTQSHGGDKSRPSFVHLFSGIIHIYGNRLLLGAITLDLFALLLGGATAMMPVFAFDVLQVGERGFGLLRSAPAVGAVSMGLFLAHRPISRNVGKWIFASTSVYGLTIIAFGLSRSLVLSLAILVVLGAVETVGAFVRQTLVQLSVHDDMRGRVTSVNMMFGSARTELGEMETGLVAALIGTVPAVIFGGLGTIVIAGIWSRLFPTLRTVDRYSDVVVEAAAPAASKLEAAIEIAREREVISA